MHNVHEQAPVAFETRWALSYLRGPMGREELRRFAQGASRQPTPAPPPIPGAPPAAAAPRRHRPPSPSCPPASRSTSSQATVDARPSTRRFCMARLACNTPTRKRGIDVTRSLQAIVAFASGPIPVDWDRAEETPHPPETLTSPSTSTPAPPSAAPAGGAGQEALRRVDQGLLAVDHARAAAEGLHRAVDEAGVEARRIRARLPGTHPAGGTRDPRRGRREAQRPLRAEAGAAAGEGAQGGRGRRQGAAAGVAAEGADRGVARRDHARCADGPTRGVALDAGASDDRSSRRRPIGERNAGRRASAGAAAGSASRARRARIRTSERSRGARGAAPGAMAIETIEIKPKRGGVEVRIVALAWKPTS